MSINEIANDLNSFEEKILTHLTVAQLKMDLRLRKLSTTGRNAIDNALEWLKEVDRISTLANWSDELKLTNAISRLSGSAKNWQLTTVKNYNDWTTWKTALASRFRRRITMHKFLSHQSERKLRHSETLVDYIYAKDAFLEKAHFTIPQPDRISMIIGDITEEKWQIALATQNSITVEDLIDRATALDAIRSTIQDKMPYQSPKSQMRSFYIRDEQRHKLRRSKYYLLALRRQRSYFIYLPFPLILGFDWQQQIQASGTYDPNGSLCISTPSSLHLYECIHAVKPSINCLNYTKLSLPPLDDVDLPEVTLNPLPLQKQHFVKSEKLSVTQQTQLDAVIGKFADVFYSDDDNIGLCPYVEFEIELQHDKPIRYRPYCLSEPDSQFLNIQIQKWLDQRICRPSNIALHRSCIHSQTALQDEFLWIFHALLIPSRRLIHTQSTRWRL
ncbi:reverse transcriptase domain-containing protein [Trichonephila clavata]|uniref:Reverse transcriptase domain-containing protein n=1 Tax=Trichonephila clavata TaxID=2740835 RepID=A0A8X6L1V2_TRICU|nr:reverse transcriptase domain-containing protein [Trichonephila clavata]